jgi:SnoaL-like domain
MAEQQRAPNLEQMDEQQAHHFLAELFSRLSAQAEDRIRHEDYTMEWPQSGERLRGRQKMRDFQESNAGARPPRRVRRVLVKEGLSVVEGTVDYGGGREVDFVLILELRDGKVFKETRYYADPFEASEARARWFERMER